MRIIKARILALMCSLGAVLQAGVAWAGEVRVVDSAGLVRGLKITRGAANLVVTLRSEAKVLPKGECVASNVDGIAADRTVAVNQVGECVFNNVGEGTWQIAVPAGLSWRVTINE